MIKINLIKNIFGWFFLAFGVILLINSLNITGFVVFDDLDTTEGSFFGIVCIIIGLLLLKSYSSTLEDDVETHEEYHLKSRRGLRAHNNEAHYAAKRSFIETYGRKPTREELRRYTRHKHEQHDLDDVVYDSKHHKRSA